MQDVGEDLDRSEELRTIAVELREHYRQTSLHVRNVVSEIIKRTAAELADHFYRTMMAQPGAEFYLEHETVGTKLRQSLKHWLIDVFQRDIKDIESFLRRQMQIGRTHARIKVPERLVSRGARELKHSINASLRTANLSREEFASAVDFVSTVFDLTLDVITHAHISRSERNARSDEAFRLFSLNQNFATERERQRAALSEWAQTLFFEHQIDSNPLPVQSLAQSEFGLWVAHRAILLFERSLEYRRLLTLITDIDDSIEALRTSAYEERIDRLKQIRNAIGEMNSLVNLLFDNSLNAQNMRDPTTQLLNRRFVDTVISAEINMQKVSRRPFSILMIEIDRFSELCARLGDEGADTITRRTAQMIFDATRSGDSIFSMGRETFLIVRVEATLAAANRFADEIARRYSSTHFTVNRKSVLECSLNIGVAEYDGHPDPRELINRTQRALWERKTDRSTLAP